MEEWPRRSLRQRLEVKASGPGSRAGETSAGSRLTTTRKRIPDPVTRIPRGATGSGSEVLSRDPNMRNETYVARVVAPALPFRRPRLQRDRPATPRTAGRIRRRRNAARRFWKHLRRRYLLSQPSGPKSRRACLRRRAFARWFADHLVARPR